MSEIADIMRRERCSYRDAEAKVAMYKTKTDLDIIAEQCEAIDRRNGDAPHEDCATALLADASVIALIRRPIGMSTLITLAHPLEQMAKRRGGVAEMRQCGEWLVISANVPGEARCKASPPAGCSTGGDA